MSGTQFCLPVTARGYRAYIDALYDAASTLTQEAFIEGLDVVKQAMCRDVLDFPDSIKASGTTYYLSNNGDDANDGRSPETAWATIDKLKSVFDELKAGDAVLFERGSMWRQPLLEPIVIDGKTVYPNDVFFGAQVGVSYGAYGEGHKPIFNGSPFDFADTSYWIATDVPNVYECTERFANAGVVALDHTKQYGQYCERVAYKEMVGRRDFMGYADLKQDESYFNDLETGKLYLCSHHGNPGDRYRSIEIGGRKSIIRSNQSAVFENLEFCYAGYGITGGPTLTVRGCVFYWLGGAQLRAVTGETVVCGNAVEIYGPVDGLYVDTCWMYSLCDTAVTHQLWTTTGECIHKNIAFTGNVIEYCHWSIEFNNPPSTDGSLRRVENYLHAYNYVTMGGYCFGSWMMDRQNTATLYNCFGTAQTVNGICEKNIFYRCTGCLYRLRFEADKDIVFKQNIHLQDKNGKLGYLFDGDYPYTEESIELLKERTKQEEPLFFTL